MDLHKFPLAGIFIGLSIAREHECSVNSHVGDDCGRFGHRVGKPGPVPAAAVPTNQPSTD